MLKGVCTGSSESTLVKMPHCWKSRVTAHLLLIMMRIQTVKHTLFPHHIEISMIKCIIRKYRLLTFINGQTTSDRVKTPLLKGMKNNNDSNAKVTHL